MRLTQSISFQYRLLFIVFGIIGMISFISCEEDEPEETPAGDVAGTVIDRDTKEPVSSAEVTLRNFRNQPITTDRNGEFKFLDVPNDSYDLIIDHIEYEPYELNIRIKNGEVEGSSEHELIPRPPVLSLEGVELLDFQNDINSLSFSIKNIGRGILTWNIIKDDPWVNISESDLRGDTEADETASILVQVDRSLLNQGEHRSKITIDPEGGASQTIDILAQVTSQLQIEPSNLDFSHDESLQTLALRNIGNGVLSFSITVDKDWITVDPIEGSLGTETQPVKVTVDRNGVDFGNQQGKIFINSDQIDVRMFVPDPDSPILDVTTQSISFGDSEETKFLSFKNVGENDLVWSLAKTREWLSVSNYSGVLRSNESENLILTINRSGLAPGSYDDLIRITTNGGNYDIPLAMDVSSEPLLSISVDSLDFGKETNNLSFSVGNIGNGELSWTISSNIDWLSINPTSGINQSSVNVSADREILDFGSYSGQIDINSNGGLDKVIVNLTNEPPNQPPVADFVVDPEVGDLQTIFQVNASSTTDDNDPLDEIAFRWKWDNDLDYTAWSNNQTDLHQYTDTGVKTIILQTRDLNGEVSGTSRSVNVLTNLNEPEELEPNNSSSSAQLVTLGSRVKGRVDTNDEDWFKFQPSSDGYVTFKVTNKNPSGTANGGIGRVEFYREGATNPATWIDQSRLDAGESYNSNWITVSKDLVFYIKIPSRGIAPYELSTTFSEAGATNINEPNDTRATATTIAFNELVNTTVGFSEDAADWYKFEAPSDGFMYYTVKNNNPQGTISGKVGDVKFYRGQNANATTFIDNYYLDPTETRNSSWITISAGKDYFIEVPKESAAHYEISTTFKAVTFENSGEPNDTRATAQLVSTGDIITTTVGFGEDIADWYNFTAPSDGFVYISAENFNPQYAINGTPSDVNFYRGQNANPTTFIDNYYLDPTESRSTSWITISSGKEYFMEIAQSGAAQYEISSTFSAVNYENTNEPNDSRETAVNLNVGDIVQTTVGFGDDEADWYQFTIPTNGYVLITAKNHNPQYAINGKLGDVNLFRGQSANPVSSIDNYYLDPTESRSTSWITATESTEYYIEVPQAGAADYEISSTFQEVSYANQNEPDSTQALATALGLNTEIYNQVGYGNDRVDWYVFTPTTNGTFTFTVINNNPAYTVSGSLGDAELYEDGNTERIAYLASGYLDPNESRKSSNLALIANRKYYIKINASGAAAYTLKNTFSEN